jgi:hypothetical protein
MVDEWFQACRRHIDTVLEGIIRRHPDPPPASPLRQALGSAVLNLVAIIR